MDLLCLKSHLKIVSLPDNLGSWPKVLWEAQRTILMCLE